MYCLGLSLLYSKNVGGDKTLANLANYSISPNFVANFHNFHNFPYAKGLQFVKFFLPNFLQSLFTNLFYCQYCTARMQQLIILLFNVSVLCMLPLLCTHILAILYNYSIHFYVCMFFL